MNTERFKISQVNWPKRPFDPCNRVDLEEFQYFRENRKWRDNCPFELEYPFLSIPDMITQKLIDTYFDLMLDVNDE